jgi:hypothetical protein
LLLVVHPLAAAEARQAKQRALPDITVSVSRSLCETPFSLKLACPVNGAAIRYTADGSEPTWANGNEYSDSLLITNSTVLRAAAFKDRARVSSITTQSYIFLEQVKHQPKNPPARPAQPRGRAPSRMKWIRAWWTAQHRDHMIESLRSRDPRWLPEGRSVRQTNRSLINSLQRGETWEGHVPSS